MTPAREIRRGAFALALPLLVVSAVLNQQPGAWELLLGQLASTLGTLAIIVIVWTTFPSALWVQTLVVVTVGLRLARLGLPGSDLLLSAYTGASCVLYAVAGIIAAIMVPRRVARHLWLVCAICLPLMLMQILGVGEWTQVLRTDLHDAGYAMRTQYPTLFMHTGQVVLNVIQSRPAGIFPSNNLLSIVVVLTLAWHFAMPDRRSWFKDIPVLGVAVLSMAKIVALASVVLFGWFFVSGPRTMRRRVVRSLLVVAAMVWLYAWAFPGVFEYVTDWDKTVLNYQLRLNDLLYASGNRELMDEALGNLAQLPTKIDVFAAGQRESGYANIVGVLPYLAVAGVLLMIPYLRGLRGLYRRSQFHFLLAVSLALSLSLIPLVTSFLSAVLLWYLAGVALLPLVITRVSVFRQLADRAWPVSQGRPSS